MSYITGPRQPPPPATGSRATEPALTEDGPTIDMSKMSDTGKRSFISQGRQLEATPTTNTTRIDDLNRQFKELLQRESANMTVQSRQTPSRPSDGGSTQRPDDKSHQA